MKILIYISIVTFCILFIALFFIWGMYYASGHNIPVSIDRWFLSAIIIDVGIIGILIFILKKKYKKES
ncbi:hypothetical protein QLS31_01615 [Flavobacterium sp. XS2P24]|uniref:hypothetical protein n=1 Tax=Flavobacterium sp. XS2P24 TaxID=3041249 RepID=UPI0024A8588B|nr:hypothetical protein [Flavobacterium sp. XS2P24]MDI6048521.1 hypothetical protein [Flavobacterium sp. XS2P24]